MSSYNNVIVEGVFIEHHGSPAIFIDIDGCNSAQIAALDRMRAASADGDFPIDGVADGIENVKISRKTVEIIYSNARVKQDGFVLNLCHLKSYGQIFVRQYIKKRAELPIGQSRFAFTLDRDGIMQGWSCLSHTQTMGYSLKSRETIRFKSSVPPVKKESRKTFIETNLAAY